MADDTDCGIPAGIAVGCCKNPDMFMFIFMYIAGWGRPPFAISAASYGPAHFILLAAAAANS